MHTIDLIKESRKYEEAEIQMEILYWMEKKRKEEREGGREKESVPGAGGRERTPGKGESDKWSFQWSRLG